MAADSFKANPWGLYNVHGNVWEWTEDCVNYSDSGYSGDGRARTSGDCSRREARGGSWNAIPQVLRSAWRGAGGKETGSRTNITGFRVARSLSP